ncbi:hypothetical protein F3Y22_tig00116984pilonHSYRG00048 [Hibiscus syriacus]|uniref:Uncharacterized protein n=1 Tax=Hibiscus syriacus TaxID=106335 RepID=A0A6A2WG05_HIBSY|nr:hypothetical protein F3Y22_tig00116984pilonHSYRG00048 [Hibiscus syriacus]
MQNRPQIQDEEAKKDFLIKFGNYWPPVVSRRDDGRRWPKTTEQTFGGGNPPTIGRTDRKVEMRSLLACPFRGIQRPPLQINIEDYSQEQAQVGGEPGELQNKQQVVEVPSFDERKLRNENSHSPSNMEVLEGGNDKSVTKLVSKKLAKLTKQVNKPDMQSENACEKSPQMSFKGLRESSSASRSNIKEYGLEQLQVVGEHDELKNKQQDVEVPSLDEEGLEMKSERETHKSASEHETYPPTINLDSAKDVKRVAKCQNSATSKTQFIDDEIQDPMRKMTMILRQMKKEVWIVWRFEKESNKRRKQLAGRAMMMADPSNSTNNLVEENSSVLKNVEEKENEKENFMLQPADKPKSSVTSSKVEISGAEDKSRPVCHVEVSGKSISKPSNKRVKTNEKFQKVDSNKQPLQKAGKFLAEEPYEWHKNGLSEDGAINLEAPRKWRQLRERTDHGAFYGMRIIVYGECIAPPLVAESALTLIVVIRRSTPSRGRTGFVPSVVQAA